MAVAQKSEHPAVPLLGIYSRQVKTYVYTKSWTQMFIAALFIITKKWEQPKSSSTNEWINNVVDSYKGLKIKRIIINSCGF